MSLLEALKRWGTGALEFNQATLSGAIDVIVVEYEDGTMVSTPFHVRFGKLQLLRSKEKRVQVSVNGKPTDVEMKLGNAGEAFFVEPIDEGVNDPTWLTSPLTRSPESSPERPTTVADDDFAWWTWSWGGLPIQHERSKRLRRLSSEPAPRGSSGSRTRFDMPARDASKDGRRQSRTGRGWFRGLFGMFSEAQREATPREARDTVVSVVEPEDTRVDDVVDVSCCVMQDGRVEVLISVSGLEAASDDESEFFHSIAEPGAPQLQLSLCGTALTSNAATNLAAFRAHRVSYDAFAANPALLFDPALILRYDGVYYPATVALPHLVSHLAFGRPLPRAALDALATPAFAHLDTAPSRSSYRKALRPTSEQLQQLGLARGQNTIAFTVTSALQGTQTVEAYIYVWPETSKLVISDVDGTITRSDILGNLMPLVGRDWSHSGVAELFSSIEASGYKMVYLTSRAIGQANITRDMLHAVQQGPCSLPEGPVIMSPDGLVHSFKREVIQRRPHDFKIPALRDVRNLFPDEASPFVAGFGNRPTDLVSYKAVGVPLSRIFIINPKGQIHHVNHTYRKSYPLLSAMANEMFPPVDRVLEPEYGLLYWKEPYRPLSDSEEEFTLS